ncbi:hypothetical protein WAI453_009813 [Rhynchosporium graminicola]
MSQLFCGCFEGDQRTYGAQPSLASLSIFSTYVLSHLDTRHMHGVLERLSIRDPSRRTHAQFHRRQNKVNRKKGNNNKNNNNNEDEDDDDDDGDDDEDDEDDDASGLTLLANAIQTGSSKDGSVNGKQNPGQSASKTSNSNFINICSGKTLTNGLQVLAGSCNGIPMGDLPSKKNMVSAIIVFPESGDNSIVEKTTFKIEVQMSNLVPGTFTNAASTYYSSPQFLQNGKIVGHVHVTVQDTGNSLNPKKPLDPTQFVFFKGINDAGNGKGLLSATVTGGLKAGNYRLCTITAAANHQPVLMPVAQRGGQDDCTKFTVRAAGSVGGANGGNNAGNNEANNGGNNGGSAAPSSRIASSSKAETKSSKANAVKTSSGAVSPSKAESTSATKKTRKGQGGNAGKASKKSFATVAPFQNSTIAQTTTIAGNGGNGGKGNGKGNDNGGNGGQQNGGKGKGNNNIKDATKPIAVQATTTAKATLAPSIVAVETTKKANNVKPAFTGKANINSGKQTPVVIVHKVVVIKTFFKFVFSLGGLPPAVDKKGNSFIVIGDVFDDFPSACAAACGHQWKKCISFSGPGFSYRDCTSQRQKCGNVAISALAPPAPETITATVTAPPTASVTGSVLSELTVTITLQASQTSPTLGEAEAIVTKAVESECAIVTAKV